MPSKLDGTMVDSNRDPRRGALQRPPDHTDGFSIPVEDGAVLNRYHERYEEVGTFVSNTPKGIIFKSAF